MSRRRQQRKRTPRNQKQKNLPAPAPKPSQDAKNEESTSSVRSLSVYRSEMYQGPLPPPEYLQRYDEISPGAATKIIDAAVSQTHHRIEIETQVITAKINHARWGLVCGFIIGLVSISGGIYIAITVPTEGATIAGSLLSGVTLVGLVGVFIRGTNSQREERIEKAKNNP